VIPVIDLFAGPGGLNEGFSRLNEPNDPAFETIGSFEMESSAIQTLMLRGVYRHLLRTNGVPQSYYKFIRGEMSLEDFKSEPEVAAAFVAAQAHVHQVELGVDQKHSDALIRAALEKAGVLDTRASWVLIGGPPCQAYSLAGRSRRAKDLTFAEDKKHFLYKEYLNILTKFAPPVFVMENVKGLLSSATTGVGMFEKIKEDLESPGGDTKYDLHSLVVDEPPNKLKPTDFIIKAERFGIPQKRHRVILLGIRRGFFQTPPVVGKLAGADEVSVEMALFGMPKLRSGISPVSMDSLEKWLEIRLSAAALTDVEVDLSAAPGSRGVPSTARMPDEMSPSAFRDWVLDGKLDDVVQHETRNHMAEDLKRYFFASALARESQISPKLSHFPPALQPNHENASSALRPFEDRFRVQVFSKPSTTVVSHIAKDGHYYIHPDPSQMRSLTVREAARLQSFPDNYFFMGSRTQQYHQVGNAVPPLLANQIARLVLALFNTPAHAIVPTLET
jgi:DNA (cytosine-5)-methyltransferase 1